MEGGGLWDVSVGLLGVLVGVFSRVCKGVGGGVSECAAVISN